MTRNDFAKLVPGDIVRSVGSAIGYVVTANYGTRVTAVRTADLTNPDEWELVLPSDEADIALRSQLHRELKTP